MVSIQPLFQFSQLNFYLNRFVVPPHVTVSISNSKLEQIHNCVYMYWFDLDRLLADRNYELPERIPYARRQNKCWEEV